MTSVSLLETAERPGPLDLVAATHNLGHGDKLSATLVARALAAYIIVGDAACMLNMHRVAIDHEMAKPVRRTCSCVGCDGLVRLLRTLVRASSLGSTRYCRARLRRAMRTSQRLGHWMDRGIDDSVPPEMPEIGGEGAQREAESRKIHGCMILQGKIALKAVRLLENCHETGPRRTIERALFPRIGPSARLIAKFLFGAFSCFVLRGQKPHRQSS